MKFDAVQNCNSFCPRILVRSRKVLFLTPLSPSQWRCNKCLCILTAFSGPPNASLLKNRNLSRATLFKISFIIWITKNERRLKSTLQILSSLFWYIIFLHLGVAHLRMFQNKKLKFFIIGTKVDCSNSHSLRSFGRLRGVSKIIYQNLLTTLQNRLFRLAIIFKKHNTNVL